MSSPSHPIIIYDDSSSTRVSPSSLGMNSTDKANTPLSASAASTMVALCGAPSHLYRVHYETSKGVWSDGSISQRHPAVIQYLRTIRQNPLIAQTCSTVVFAAAALAVYYKPVDTAHWHFWSEDMRLETAKIVNAVYFHERPLLHSPKVTWVGIPENIFLLRVVQSGKKNALASTTWYSAFLPSTAVNAAKRNLRKRKAAQAIADDNSILGEDDSIIQRPSRKKPRNTTASHAKADVEVANSTATRSQTEYASKASSPAPSGLATHGTTAVAAPGAEMPPPAPARNRSASHSSAETTIAPSGDSRHRRSVSRSSASTAVSPATLEKGAPKDLDLSEDNIITDPTTATQSLSDVVQINIETEANYDDQEEDESPSTPPLAVNGRSRRSIRVTARAAAAAASTVEDNDVLSSLTSDDGNDNDDEMEEATPKLVSPAKTRRVSAGGSKRKTSAAKPRRAKRRN